MDLFMMSISKDQLILYHQIIPHR
uniref:Uncharacterized protein n=1 Tax=Arundo donax TaxID=35708 RepID=A0A0A9D5L3_ARUDO